MAPLLKTCLFIRYDGESSIWLLGFSLILSHGCCITLFYQTLYFEILGGNGVPYLQNLDLLSNKS